MSRPRIICHMHTLLNGKIDGIANPTSVDMRSQKLYFDLFLGEDRFYNKHRGWLSGTATSRASWLRRATDALSAERALCRTLIATSRSSCRSLAR